MIARTSRTARAVGRRAAALTVVAAGLAAPLALGAPTAAADAVRTAQWPISFLNLPQAWKTSKGVGVTIAVLDSGVAGDRPDLTGQVTTGQDFVGGVERPGDANWGVHGTGMASIIAGHGHGVGNGDGIVGVAPAAKILSVRVIRDDESPDRGLAETSATPISNGIRYAVDHGAQVISMSLGGSIPGAGNDDSAEADAVRYAIARNVSVVVASGNSGEHPDQDVTQYPAGERGVIGVAAVDSKAHRAFFSSTGWDVAVAAPGVAIPMVLPIDDPGGLAYADFGPEIGTSILVGDGTSPACAYVAGVVALVRSAFPKLSPEQIEQLLKTTASHRPAGGRDDAIGNGVVDPVAALKAAAALTPAPVTALAAPYTGPQHFGYGPVVDAAEPGAPLSTTKRGLANAGIAVAASLWIGGWLLLRGRRRARLARPAQGTTTMAMTMAMTPPRPDGPRSWRMTGLPEAPTPVPGQTPSPSPSPSPSIGASAQAETIADVAVVAPSAATPAVTPPATLAATPEPPAKVEAMNQFAGKSLAPSPFPADDGTADPTLLAVLEAHGRGHTELERAYGTLLNARVLAPIVAVLGEAEDVQIADGRTLKSDKNSDMALVTLIAPDGTRALPVFTSVAALTAWNPQARPMPVAFPHACAAAQAEKADVVLVDLGQPSYLEVEPAAVRAFAAMLEQQQAEQQAQAE